MANAVSTCLTMFIVSFLASDNVIVGSARGGVGWGGVGVHIVGLGRGG